MGDITLFQVIVVGLLLFIAWWTTKCLGAIETLAASIPKIGNGIVHNVGVETNKSLADFYKEIEEVKQLLYTIEEKVEQAAVDIDTIDEAVDRIENQVSDLHFDAKFRDPDLDTAIGEVGSK